MAKTYHVASIYVKAVFDRTSRQQLKKEILQEKYENKAFREEIRRVFQMANRRIQNIENAGLFSPAVGALNKGNIEGYTKFSMAGDWETLKLEYGKAITFLRQPTSTLTGVRNYNEHLRQTYDLTEDEFNLMSRSLNNKLSSISDTNFVERYLMRYKDFTGELEQEARDLSDQIEDEAHSIRRAMEADVERSVNEAVKIQDQIEAAVRRFNKG